MATTPPAVGMNASSSLFPAFMEKNSAAVESENMIAGLSPITTFVTDYDLTIFSEPFFLA